METKLLSTSQAAEILGVDDSRVRQLILSGRLPSMQVGRAHLIKESDLALVAERKAGRPKKDSEANGTTAEAASGPTKKEPAKNSTGAKATAKPAAKNATRRRAAQ